MKATLFVVLTAAGALAVGCSKSQTPAETGGASSAQSSEKAGGTANAGVHEIHLVGSDQMKYNITHIEAKAGETLHVTLENSGSLPKAAMAHNFVLLKKGTDPDQFDIAASQAPQSDYFPPNGESQVIAHTRMAGPKETVEVTFQAPSEPGEYTYLCTFPGHYQAGMKGVLVVK